MDEVDCNGSEGDIFECKHRSIDDCSTQEGAGVICAGKNLTNHTYIQHTYVT